MTSYRYPGEQAILFVTVIALLGVLALTALTTLCLVPLAVLVFVAITYNSSRDHHQQLLRKATLITDERTPNLAAIARQCVSRLRPGAVQIFVTPSNKLNAYTFGLSKPNVVVLYSPMLEVMDEDELRFVIGHELGHVALGHSWLNTLLGGMAGVPGTFAGAIILTLVFRWWNRACEFSCDRAGLVACGNLNKAISALAQLAVGDINTQTELRHALQFIEKRDNSLTANLMEVLSTHPMVLKRIKELQKFAASAQYQKLRAEVE